LPLSQIEINKEEKV